MVKWGQDALYLGNFPVRYYGILIALGVLAGALVAMRREKRLGLARDTAIDLLLVCAPCALVGARLYYVAFSWDAYRDNLWKIFSVREGGMAIYGSVIFGVLAALAFARARKIPFFALADLAAPSLALGQAVGRWGNFFNQEAYGLAVTDARWQWFPAAVYIQADQSWHLATFFYESVWCLGIAVFLIVWEKRGRKKQRSEVFWWYVLLYGLERAVVEGLRTDSLMLGAVRVSQALSALLAAVAAAALCVLAARRRRLRF